MEVYLLLATVLLYMITAVLLDARTRKRLWLAGFVITAVITAIALSFWRFTNQEVMMNVVAISWYYLLYLSLSIMMVLGIINLWIFRRQLWLVLTGDDDEEDINEPV